jgi:hypothetical protein
MSLVYCESYLEGSFSRNDGVVFTASMSATGQGIDCNTAKENAEQNLQKTLENFLTTYTPTIVDYTFTINTSCDNTCNVVKYVLQIKKTGTYDYVPRKDIPFNVKYSIYALNDSVDKTIMEFSYVNFPLNDKKDNQDPFILSIYNNSVNGELYSVDGTFIKNVTVFLDDKILNNQADSSYTVEAIGNGFESADLSIVSDGSLSLPDNIVFNLLDGSGNFEKYQTNEFNFNLVPLLGSNNELKAIISASIEKIN